MLYKSLIDHCSPTLAGIKTGNLFPLHSEKEDIIPEIREWNRVLAGKGLRMIPVKRDNRRTLVYIYRPERLKKDLAVPEAKNILRERGYPCEDPDKCVTCLMRHLQSDPVFPHEVGLFLSYPPADVKCFMKDTKEGVQCVGCWKAYGNVTEAERTFARFEKCTKIYKSLMEKGKSIEQLVV